jgi:hypothetical protein
MSDYILEAKVKNGLIVRAMRECGYTTVASLARACHVKQGALGRLLNLKLSALDSEGQWRPQVIRLCECLNRMPAELFNQQQQEVALKTNKVERFIEAADIQYFMQRNRPVEELLEYEHLQKDVDELLSGLLPREARIIKKRFGIDGEERTLRSLVQEEGVTVERVRQIEAKGLRKMRARGGLRHYITEVEEGYEAAQRLREENKRRSEGDFGFTTPEQRRAARNNVEYKGLVGIYNKAVNLIDTPVKINFLSTERVEGHRYIVGKALLGSRGFVVKSPVKDFGSPEELVRSLIKQVEETCEKTMALQND